MRLKNIEHIYKGKYDDFVLKVQNLEIKPGEVIGLLGSNGSGKSTLLQIITGSLRPNTGIVEFTNNWSISYNIQESEFMDVMVGKFLVLLREGNRTNVNIEKLLHEYNLINVRAKRFNQLSFGQRQRLRFLTCLIKDFDLLILDEIFAGLDYEWIGKINKKILQFIEEKKTIIYVSHNIKEVVKYCQRIIELKDGEIINDFQLIGTDHQKIEQIKNQVDYIREFMEE